MNMHADQAYLELLEKILNTGNFKSNRTGVDTLSLFAQSLRFDLREGFPLLTTKSVNFHAIGVELLWFIAGGTNIRPLLMEGVHIWDEWPFRHYLQTLGLWEEMKDSQGSSVWKSVKKDFCDRIIENEKFAEIAGELGPVYGKQWRAWKGSDGKTYDQLAEAIRLLRVDPHSRRIIVNSWNVADLEDMVESGLPPCHYTYQFYVVDDALSCVVEMRSADMFLGVPFNIASYALLTHLVAEVTNLKATELQINLADAHLYLTHRDQAELQLSRGWRDSPTVAIAHRENIDNFVLGDITLTGYNSHEAIKGAVAI